MIQEPSTTSGDITADGVVLNKPGRLDSCIVIADGTNAASVILYDNASAASGTVLARVSIPATGVYQVFLSEAGIIANKGIYADVTGTGCIVIVHFRPGN